jgi:hypothetical protein
MKLNRSGAKRYRGKTQFFDQPAEVVAFDPKTQTVELRAKGRDPVTRSTYEYELSLGGCPDSC